MFRKAFMATLGVIAALSIAAAIGIRLLEVLLGVR